MGHSTSLCKKKKKKKRLTKKGKEKVTKVNAETVAENKSYLGVIAALGPMLTSALLLLLQIPWN